jgi:cytochrome c-type biogenesis protein
MGEILTAFGNAFAASAALALPAAFLWGVLSVVLSPCHLSSIPLVVAYMNGGTEYPDWPSRPPHLHELRRRDTR